jgi:hypothetical protein
MTLSSKCVFRNKLIQHSQKILRNNVASSCCKCLLLHWNPQANFRVKQHRGRLLSVAVFRTTGRVCVTRWHGSGQQRCFGLAILVVLRKQKLHVVWYSKLTVWGWHFRWRKQHNERLCSVFRLVSQNVCTMRANVKIVLVILINQNIRWGKWMKFTKYGTIAKVYVKNLYMQMARLRDLGGCFDVGKHSW